MQEAGANHTHWQQQLQATGLFVYDETWDKVRDFLTSNEMTISKTAGGYNLVVGGLKAAGKASLGTVSCGTTVGCLATIAIMATIPNDLKQSLSGSQQLLADYEHKEGQRVLDSFNPASHWGDQDPLKTLPPAILNATLDITELSLLGLPQSVQANLRESKTVGQAVQALRKTPQALKDAANRVGSKFRPVSTGAAHVAKTADKTDDVAKAAAKTGQGVKGAEKASLPIELTKAKFGHTFEVHGQNATDFLTRRAAGGGKPVGQFLDDQVAAQFIQDNLSQLAGGAKSIAIPANFPARVIMPDGKYLPATKIRIVPSGNGVKTAYPEL